MAPFDWQGCSSYPSAFAAQRRSAKTVRRRTLQAQRRLSGIDWRLITSATQAEKRKELLHLINRH
jgi:hypothetical protein